MPPGAAQGGLERKGGGDLLGRPQPGRREGQPAAREEGAAAPPRVAPESGGEREQADPPLGEEPPGKGGGFSARAAAGGERAPGGHTPGLREKSAERLHVGERPALELTALEPPAQLGERRGPDRRGGGRCGFNRGRKTRRAKGPTAKPAWEWILLALCLWGALQMGAALVLKGNRVEGEVFTFDALRCDNSHALARY